MLLPSFCYAHSLDQNSSASAVPHSHAWSLAALSTTPYQATGQGLPFYTSAIFPGACDRSKDVPLPQSIAHERTRSPHPKAKFYPEMVYQVKEGERPPLSEVSALLAPSAGLKFRCLHEFLRIRTRKKSLLQLSKKASESYCVDGERV